MDLPHVRCIRRENPFQSTVLVFCQCSALREGTGFIICWASADSTENQQGDGDAEVCLREPMQLRCSSRPSTCQSYQGQCRFILMTLTRRRSAPGHRRGLRHFCFTGGPGLLWYASFQQCPNLEGPLVTKTLMELEPTCFTRETIKRKAVLPDKPKTEGRSEHVCSVI